ncbi:MAG: hypothetical protein IPL46_23100 [Saprospiraceae bacterium]|nr:hypothetical protein [Saprospiraceae bacterium]
MYSKTFSIENYFMHIPEYVLDEGRELLNSSALNSASKDVKGLWLLRWKGEPDCETEVFVGRKNVKAYSCDCSIFQERKMCCHVSAAIHHIHETIEKEKLVRKK